MKKYSKIGKYTPKIRIPIAKPGKPHELNSYDRLKDNPCKACGFQPGSRCKYCDL